MTSAIFSASPLSHEHLDLDLGHEVDLVLGAPVGLGVAALAAEALDLGDREAGHAGLSQGVLHRVEHVRLHDGGHEVQHRGPPGRSGRFGGTLWTFGFSVVFRLLRIGRGNLNGN